MIDSAAVDRSEARCSLCALIRFSARPRAHRRPRRAIDRSKRSIHPQSGVRQKAHAGRHALEVGDDEPGVAALRRGLDPGDDPALDRPGFGGIAELAVAADLHRLAGNSAHGCLVDEPHDLGQQHLVAGQAEDIADAVVNRLGNGTPDRRAKGTPLVGVGAPPAWLARSRRRSGEQAGEAGSEGAQARFLKRQLSLPVSTISQWWVRRSSSAVVILASPKTLGHSPKARLVVTMIEVCS